MLKILYICIIILYTSLQPLYHITKKENLISILIDATFRTSYAREIILGDDRRKEFGAPMISFCNLPLSKLKCIMGSYGKFGIGVTREWADRQKIKKVDYVHKQSKLISDLFDEIEESHKMIWNRPGTYCLHDIYAYYEVLNKLRYIPGSSYKCN